MSDPKNLTYIFLLTFIIIMGLFAARVIMVYDNKSSVYKFQVEGDVELVEEADIRTS
jgi:hypothetical protein